MKGRPLSSLVILAALLAAFMTAGIGQASPATQGRAAAPIRFKAATFTPARGEAPAVAPGLTIASYAGNQRGYYVVQASGPITQVWKDQVAAQGAELLDYVPDYAYKVRMNPAQAAKIAALAEVAWVGFFHPAYKLDTNLKRNGANLYEVIIERGADVAAAGAAVNATGAQVLGVSAGKKLLVGANAAQLDAIAKVLDVAWIQNFQLNETHNEYGGGSIIGATIANNSGYDGSTQISAVADTGIGGGTASTAHRDIPASRVQGIFNWPGATDSCFQQIVDDGSVDVGSGHGTHVAGSVLSGGGPSGEGKGVAPSAKLVFQSIENYVVTSSLCKNFYGYQNDYYLAGLTDLYGLFNQAYNAGARIHSNSWGSAAAGDYTDNSVTSDQFIWDKKDMTITFSAGNEGIDANANGVIDNDSIGAPATAKNVITIGASENDRLGNYQCDTSLAYQSRDAYQPNTTCSGMGGNNILGTYGVRWPADYPANPIKDDPTAGNQQQMAAFSSRGPTDDGRIKPDVVAPGTWILSTYSDMYQEGYDASANPRNNAFQLDGWGMPRNGFYKYFGGTSMSNPIAGGAAAVVRDFYQKAYGANASAALVKATLINSAVDLLDENNDGANDNDFPIPNVHEGWGRIDLVNATDGSAKYDDSRSASTGANVAYTANVATSGNLKISLVWSDYPSTAAAATNLVNNLNLTVTAPNGTIYRGNVFAGGWSATGGSADSANNVENVYVQSAATGTWTITVSGANVPNGPQPFALVVDGASSLTGPAVVVPPAAPSNLTATPFSASRIDLSWSNVANETGYKIERCTGSTCTNFAQIATVGVDVTSYSNTGLAKNTTYRYRVRATNSGGDSAPSNVVNATTPRK